MVSMKQWFEVGVKYEKLMENGMNKKVVDSYLVDSLSFTEGEGRTIEEIAKFISGEFEIKTMKKSNISEIFTSSGEKDDTYYKAKVGFIAIDEKSGLEKRTHTNVLVQADSLETAVKYLHEKMIMNSMADCVIVSVAETKIVDICEYKDEK
jgi:high-affinity Fe2+/Pb2+ permease